jgi:hypothetical protein
MKIHANSIFLKLLVLRNYHIFLVFALRFVKYIEWTYILSNFDLVTGKISFSYCCQIFLWFLCNLCISILQRNKANRVYMDGWMSGYIHRQRGEQQIIMRIGLHDHGGQGTPQYACRCKLENQERPYCKSQSLSAKNCEVQCQKVSNEKREKLTLLCLFVLWGPWQIEWCSPTRE